MCLTEARARTNHPEFLLRLVNKYWVVCKTVMFSLQNKRSADGHKTCNVENWAYLKMSCLTFKNYSISIFVEKNIVLLDIKTLTPQKVNNIHRVATNLERIFPSVRLLYFGFDYEGFKTPVTKPSMTLLLYHL